MRRLLVCALLTAIAPASAFAQDEPPPVRRAGGGGGGPRIGASSVSGDQGIRPFLGVSGDLGVDRPTTVSGNKFLFGADYYIGGPYGFTIVLGLHLGAGGAAFMLHPLIELQYRFRISSIPLVPWIGGGGGFKVGFRRDSPVNLAVTFRFVTGVDFFFSDSIGVGMQLAIPDLGPRLTPSVGVVGTVEWTIGPHFRF